MSGIVVADAGPIHYLILIGAADSLKELFDEVFIPRGVGDELLQSSTPGQVKDWISSPKPWFKIEAMEKVRPIHGLHRGEVEAIQLALKIKANALLIDDLDGRAAARSLGLIVIGTVGLLERSAEKGLLNLPDAIGKLRQTNFFISPALLDAALERDRIRRAKAGDR